MSNYLGFEPCNNPNFYFVSYNSEDADRVGVIAQRLAHSNVPLWYDHGIDYGENWESKISKKLSDAQAIILFFTKGILFKNSSYVRKEYKMATEFFNKKVYVVMLDVVDNKAVPPDKVPWLIDLQEKQCIDLVEIDDLSVIASRILTALGIENHEDKMNQMIGKYRSLYEFGKVHEAEEYLEEYLKGKTLTGKVKCIANLFSGKIAEFSLPSSGCEVAHRLGQPLKNHVGNLVDIFFECEQLTLGNTVFTFGNSCLFHRGHLGDAHIINVWRGQDNIYTVGALVEARNLKLFYDNVDDIIYIIYTSTLERAKDGTELFKDYISITTMEDPLGSAVCNSFQWLVCLDE